MKGFNLDYGTPVDVLIAKLRELGREEEVEMILKADHRWEDLSYHGSPSYYCEYCGVSMLRMREDEPCPKAVQKVAEKVMEEERKELHEYQRLRAERERYLYLSEKFGDLE